MADPQTSNAPASPPADPLPPAAVAPHSRITALHMAIEHAANHAEHRGAADVIELAERFWKFLVKEVKALT